MKTYQSFSSKETKKLGEKLAREIAAAAPRRNKKKGALVFALQGELGAGKTTFVQGFFGGLGLRKRAPSPTFIIMRRHALPRRKGRHRNPRGTRAFSNVFHVDAYRLKKAADLKMLGVKDIAADPANIILVEWADRVRSIIPKNAQWLRFEHGKRENERRIIMKQQPHA